MTKKKKKTVGCCGFSRCACGTACKTGCEFGD